MVSNWGPGSVNEKLWKLQGGLCCYCEDPMTHPPRRSPSGRVVPKCEASREHLRRREDGGLTIPDNLALACTGCNTGRGQMDWLTYKTYVQDRKALGVRAA